ncbi:hypothetical protein IMSAGC004_02013 [Bacteroidaceae bacterium]|nr:hypothetical protein IMSAGC004_02013 [Bacteroidaceae bacterium]
MKCFGHLICNLMVVGNKHQKPKKALDLVRSAGGRDFEIEAAPSVLANDGVGMWGTGGGVYYPGTDKAYVDPIKGTVTTAVHEAAHASFPTKLVDKEQQKAAYEKLNKSFATATPGNNLRAVYETMYSIMLHRLIKTSVTGAAAKACTPIICLIQCMTAAL